MNLEAKRVIGMGILALSSAWPLAGQVVREIDDPNTGDRWLLMSGSGQPGGPGRLVLVAGLKELRQPGAGAAPSQPLPVIHSGDRLVVEENTALVQARLGAVALGPALLGGSLRLRLAIGGNVVEAVALGPGRAAFAQPAGPRP
jgi:hypothetical protein